MFALYPHERQIPQALIRRPAMRYLFADDVTNIGLSTIRLYVYINAIGTYVPIALSEVFKYFLGELSYP